MLFSWELLAKGFGSALTPENILFAAIGSLLGTLIGVLPGIGPSGGIAMLLPLTTVLPPTPMIIMLAAIYYGAQYGGSTTAIVVNIPGEATSVVTAIDGYQMAKQGRGGPALGICAISSFVAGTLSVVALTFFAPALASVALAFGPPESFALMLMSLCLIVSISGGGLLKSIIGMIFGLLTTMVGLDPVSGAARLTFGFSALVGGINFLSLVIGLFAISEVLANVERLAKYIYETRVKDWLPTREDLWATWGTMLRATGIGFFLGVIPGALGVATYLSYDVEKRLSKHPERFGHGAIEGVAGPEGANNAASTGSLVPLFSLGIPAGSATAVLMGGLLMYGLQPGPRLFQERPDVVWAVIASMYIGNVMLLILNLPLIGLWTRMALIPFPILGPFIVIFSVLGTYSVSYSMLDVWVTLISGVAGYFMRKLGFPVIPIVLAAILGPQLEIAFNQSLHIGYGSPLILVTRPIALAFMVLAFLILAWTAWRQMGRRSVRVDEQD
jgi:putative tricarboxylic transport membrane protein